MTQQPSIVEIRHNTFNDTTHIVTNLLVDAGDRWPTLYPVALEVQSGKIYTVDKNRGNDIGPDTHYRGGTIISEIKDGDMFYTLRDPLQNPQKGLDHAGKEMGAAREAFAGASLPNGKLRLITTDEVKAFLSRIMNNPPQINLGDAPILEQPAAPSGASIEEPG